MKPSCYKRTKDYEIAMIEKTPTNMIIFSSWLFHLTIKNKKITR